MLSQIHTQNGETLSFHSANKRSLNSFCTEHSLHSALFQLREDIRDTYVSLWKLIQCKKFQGANF